MSVNLHDELQALSDLRPTRDLWADALARVGSGSRFHPPRRRLHSKLAWVTVTVVAVAAAAMIGYHGYGRSAHATARSNGEAIDWKHPLLNGLQVPSISEAAADFDFSPVAPAALGSPTAIWETDPSKAELGDRVAVLVYADSPYGPYWLEESRTVVTGVGPMLVKQCLSQPGCEADRVEVVTLKDGSQASVQRQEGSVQNASWDHNGVMYSILGEADSMSWDQAISLANGVVAAAANPSSSSTG
jgi:hypothetical protein